MMTCRFCGSELEAVETALAVPKFRCGRCGHTHLFFAEGASPVLTGLVLAHDRACCDAVFTPVVKRPILEKRG